MSGTSMATLAVFGVLASLREAFLTFYQTAPTGAMLKALLIHGTIDLCGTNFVANHEYTAMTSAPNTCQGWGLVNLARSLSPMIGDIPERGGHQGIIHVSETWQREIRIDHASSDSLVATLVWTDLSGRDLQVNLKFLASGPYPGADARPYEPMLPNDPLQGGTTWGLTTAATEKIVIQQPQNGVYYLQVLYLQPFAEVDTPISFAVVWSILS